MRTRAAAPDHKVVSEGSAICINNRVQKVLSLLTFGGLTSHLTGTGVTVTSLSGVLGCYLPRVLHQLFLSGGRLMVPQSRTVLFISRDDEQTVLLKLVL